MDIELKNITKSYGELAVFKNFSHTFKGGQISCLLGRSGSGKTTLLNILSGGITDFTGKININNGRVSYIFQEERLINSLTAYQILNLC
jgi:NitT/TauT family transport system ATP-binding protein